MWAIRLGYLVLPGGSDAMPAVEIFFKSTGVDKHAREFKFLANLCSAMKSRVREHSKKLLDQLKASSTQLMSYLDEFMIQESRNTRTSNSGTSICLISR